MIHLAHPGRGNSYHLHSAFIFSISFVQKLCALNTYPARFVLLLFPVRLSRKAVTGWTSSIKLYYKIALLEKECNKKNRRIDNPMSHQVKIVANFRGNMPFSSEVWQILGVEKTGMVKSGGFNFSGNGRAFYCLRGFNKAELKE